MSYYCTLFDSVYISRGLLMIESLKRYVNDLHIFVFAFDKTCYKILKDINHPFVTVISLKEFESEELLRVKPLRSKAEYCWTCTSSTIKFVFDNYKVAECTYLDADLYFYNSPNEIFRESSSSKDILITSHNYSLFSKIIDEKRAGKYCVQFIRFTNSEESLNILNQWSQQCIDWCFARYEDNKFGDQKYLDSWPTKYKNVHVVRNHGAGLAPWNVQKYRYKKRNKITSLSYQRKQYQIIFFHFHYVRLLDQYRTDIGWNRIPSYIREQLYKPYLKELKLKNIFLEENYSYYYTTYYSPDNTTLKNKLKNVFKTISKYNILYKNVQ